MNLTLRLRPQVLIDLTPFYSLSIAERSGRYALVGSQSPEGGPGTVLCYFGAGLPGKENSGAAWNEIVSTVCSDGRCRYADIHHWTTELDAPAAQDLGIAGGEKAPKFVSFPVAENFPNDDFQASIGRVLAAVAMQDGSVTFTLI